MRLLKGPRSNLQLSKLQIMICQSEVRQDDDGQNKIKRSKLW